jgi:Adenosine-deaminase (editase) domain
MDTTRTAKAPPVRHVEARRTASCGFANRIATAALKVFRSQVGFSQPTCVAAILAYDGQSLTVLSMGVGTKFLPSKQSLGAVRDMHAETLCRRGLRRFLTNEIRLGLPSSVLRKDGDSGRFLLRENVTLHLYCSSAPCGNATIKKFATFQKESYRNDFDDTWPKDDHPEIERHSLHKGQCALLLKKNPSADLVSVSGCCPGSDPRLQLSSKMRSWPMYCSTDWCPPGTTASWDLQHGSIHTCSDKLALWNMLGWQGSLLTPRLVDAIRPVTMTVGRKYSRVTCRRAVCCRVTNCPNHVFVMGDAVYMDESGAIDTLLEPEMRFHSKQCWVLWKNSPSTSSMGTEVFTNECINTATGRLWMDDSESSISTLRLIEDLGLSRPDTIALRELKQAVSPAYETFKKQLLNNDPVFKDWHRRDDLSCRSSPSDRAET